MCREKYCRGGRRCPGATSDSGKRAAAQRSRGARLRRKLAAADVTVTHGRNTPLTFVAIDGDVDFDPAAIPPVVDRRRAPWKPDGGLWSAPAIDTEHDGIATSWTMFHADNGSLPAWKRLVPVTVGGGGVVVHVDNAGDIARLREFYPPDPIPSDDIFALADAPPPFSFEKMAAAGIGGVHVTRRAVDTLDSFYGWDVDSTIWLNAGQVVAHPAVDAAQIPPRHHDTDDGPSDDAIRLWMLGDDDSYTVERLLGGSAEG